MRRPGLVFCGIAPLGGFDGPFVALLPAAIHSPRRDDTLAISWVSLGRADATKRRTAKYVPPGAHILTLSEVMLPSNATASCPFQPFKLGAMSFTLNGLLLGSVSSFLPQAEKIPHGIEIVGTVGLIYNLGALST
jgi:hypothetical protein